MFGHSHTVIIIQSFTLFQCVLQRAIGRRLLHYHQLSLLRAVNKLTDLHRVLRIIGLYFPQILDQIVINSFDNLDRELQGTVFVLGLVTG